MECEVDEASPAIAGSRPERLVLASGSATRAGLLRRAGVPFLQDPAGIDEAAARSSLRQGGCEFGAAALELARLKATAVGARHEGRIVLGADQLLECEGAWLEKPRGRAGARAQLLALSGRKHHLASAVVLMRDGELLWSHLEIPELRMRSLSASLIEAYLDAAGPQILESVGGYRIEGAGAQLLESLAGDVFAVLGLPLLPLLAALRREGVLP